jgi:CHAD domain-containing protein
MTERYRERLDTFEVATDYPVPDLVEVLPPGAHIERRTVTLSSRYLDTGSRDLLRHGVTLRLRSDDAGPSWRLSLRNGTGRTEVRVPIEGNQRAEGSPRAVPRQLRDVVFGIAGGAPLRWVALLETDRAITQVVDAADKVLVEIDDDHVTGTVAPSGDGVERPPAEWREVDVEVGTDDEQLISAVGQWLIAADAAPAASVTKLAKILGADSQAAPQQDAAPQDAAPQQDVAPQEETAGSVGGLVRDYLQTQYRALIAGDLALRRGQDEIHATRVATRRYRSVLRVFADLFDPEQASALDRELAWYAGLLGAVRDREVLSRHLAQTLASLPAELDPAPARARLDEYLAGQQGDAKRALLRQMRSKRYLALLATLHAWQQRPALTDAAARPPHDVAAYLDRTSHTLVKRLDRARRPAATDEALHRARKAGKRVRYAAELAAPVVGKPARRAVKRATKLQDIFGEHQDSIIASDLLLSLSGDTHTPSSSEFTLGVLYAREEQRRQASRERARAVRWRRAV